MTLTAELTKDEHKVLTTLNSLNGKATIDNIQEATGLDHSAIMRSILKLETESLAKLDEYEQTFVSLNEEGKTYSEQGLPERRLIKSLLKLGNTAGITESARKAGLPSELVPIAVGWLLRKKWAVVNKEKLTLQTDKKPGKDNDEELLDILADKGLILVEKLPPELKKSVRILQKRKLVETKEKTLRIIELTTKGKQAVRQPIKISEGLSRLTPELIISGKWRQSKLRKFNVTAPCSPIFPGKIHPLQQMIERTREIFLEMGFTEIRGPLVETAFWNFDALFTPQDHPAREMQDTFYLTHPRTGTLPEKQVVNAVSKTHVNGWTTGSKGWRRPWDRQEAKRLLLRTHTTAETIKYLSRTKTPPIKVFSVDRVYRNEQLTYKHTTEFYQIEGIVVDSGVTLRDLMGTLKAFYSRFGLKEVQFWPCYFPYTEPSAQAMVYVPKLRHWIELCGMGLFRPEVLGPMEIEHPVLAWGGGLERIAMLELGLDDIRMLYSNKLDWIRRTPLCQ